MRTRSVSGRLTLSIVLLLYGDQLATENAEGVCKTKQSHDVYVPSNNLSCERDVSDNKSFVIERYRPMKKCTSDFDITGTLSLIFIELLITIVMSQNFISSEIQEKETPCAIYK
ncbi:hypothetical protein ALC57_08376 [Trachymyrmex cornetzi]|uniref:Uncharacterized protein n=1 Tax=Trachymyrmex cornetzi TaxID=471704 RepID=A0A195E2T7_9HYME|nr:hypothetical protein ALC57_08376 [Trachymyrmex cornetzi]